MVARWPASRWAVTMRWWRARTSSSERPGTGARRHDPAERGGGGVRPAVAVAGGDGGDGGDGGARPVVDGGGGGVRAAGSGGGRGAGGVRGDAAAGDATEAAGGGGAASRRSGAGVWDSSISEAVVA